MNTTWYKRWSSGGLEGWVVVGDPLPPPYSYRFVSPEHHIWWKSSVKSSPSKSAFRFRPVDPTKADRHGPE